MAACAVSEMIVDAILEDDADKGEPVEGSGADNIDARRLVKGDLHGEGVIALHLFGREARRLGGDFQDDRGGIWIRLDVELSKGEEGAAGEQEQAECH